MPDPIPDDTYDLFGRVFQGQIASVQFISDIVHTSIMSATAGKNITTMGVLIGVGMMLRVLAKSHGGWDTPKFMQFMKDLSRFFDEHHTEIDMDKTTGVLIDSEKKEYKN